MRAGAEDISHCHASVPGFDRMQEPPLAVFASLAAISHHLRFILHLTGRVIRANPFSKPPYESNLSVFLSSYSRCSVLSGAENLEPTFFVVAG